MCIIKLNYIHFTLNFRCQNAAGCTMAMSGISEILLQGGGWWVARWVARWAAWMAVDT